MKKYILILLLTLISGCTSPVGGYIGKYKCSSLSGWCSNGTMVLGAFWDFPESIKRQYIPERPDRSAKGEELDAYWKAKAKIIQAKTKFRVTPATKTKAWSHLDLLTKEEDSRMKERDVISWNSMITEYVNKGMKKEAFQKYEEMKKEGIANGLPEFFWEVTPELMLQFLAKFREEHGSIGQYLQRQGADSSLISSLKQSLLTW